MRVRAGLGVVKRPRFGGVRWEMVEAMTMSVNDSTDGGGVGDDSRRSVRALAVAMTGGVDGSNWGRGR